MELPPCQWLVFYLLCSTFTSVYHLVSNTSFSFKVYYTVFPHIHLLVVCSHACFFYELDHMTKCFSVPCQLLLSSQVILPFLQHCMLHSSLDLFSLMPLILLQLVSQLMCATWTLPLSEILILQYIKIDIQISHFMYNYLTHSQKHNKFALSLHSYLETPIPPNITITTLFSPSFSFSLSLSHTHINSPILPMWAEHFWLFYFYVWGRTF